MIHYVNVNKGNLDCGTKRHFEIILMEWCDVINRYNEYYEGEDALYWYNERATLSTFAVAAGRKDFHVLEEYSGTKKKNGISFEGRFDLYLAKKKGEYVFEAKQCWVSISPTATTTNKKIRKAKNSAICDANKSKNNAGKKDTYGLVFIVPHIAKSFCEDQTNLIENFIKYIKEIDYDAMAYIFPKNAPTITKTSRLYPGVVCLLYCLKGRKCESQEEDK
ncbi:MAG: hypothetical protein COA91_02490 [Robiginitomaculum sp.]|nr:MAG: hypothetical protein COA91_02490 [Robiginitomaculum sp.]